MGRSYFHLHLVSDSTGETLDIIAKAGLAQFEEVATARHFWPMVRSEGHLDRVLDAVAASPGLVFHTLIKHDLRVRLEHRCRHLGLTAIPVMDPVVNALSAALGRPITAKPGRQHVMDAAYFARVDAIQFTIAHDDGIGADNWEEADIVLAGVSRTSKTPTAIYLANRGVKTANIPLVPSIPLPAALETVRRPLVVGLVASPERIVQIRQNRLLSLKADDDTDYTDRARVAEEIALSRRLCSRHQWPIIDVSRRSIEETAAAILDLYRDHRMKFIAA